MENIKYSKWLNHVPIGFDSGIGRQINGRMESNLYYKDYANIYITKINLWNSHTQGACDTHYSVTDPIPFPLYGQDFTMIINPFQRPLTQNTGSGDAKGILIQIHQKMPKERRWHEGIFAVNLESMLGDTFSQKSSHLVFDKDDDEHTTYTQTAELFGSTYTDDRKLLWNDANHVDKTSLGSFQSGKDYRLGVGVYNSSASGKSSEQSFEIMLIPHTARGKAVT